MRSHNLRDVQQLFAASPDSYAYDTYLETRYLIN